MGSTAAWFRARRARLREEGRCTRCGCDLTALVDWSHLRCPECVEATTERQRRYRDRAGVRARVAEAARGYRQRHAEEARDRSRRRYQRRKNLGLCTWCGAPCADDAQKCERCLERHRSAARAYWHRTQARKAA